jgi:hypothetical protein
MTLKVGDRLVAGYDMLRRVDEGITEEHLVERFVNRIRGEMTIDGVRINLRIKGKSLMNKLRLFRHISLIMFAF